MNKASLPRAHAYKELFYLSPELELPTAFQDLEKLLHERGQPFGAEPPGKLPYLRQCCPHLVGVGPGTTSPALAGVLAGEGPDEGFTVVAGELLQFV